MRTDAGYEYNMNDLLTTLLEISPEVFKQLPTIVTLLITAYVARKVHIINVEINSRMTELLESTKVAYTAEGRQQERDSHDGRNQPSRQQNNNGRTRSSTIRSRQ